MNNIKPKIYTTRINKINLDNISKNYYLARIQPDVLKIQKNKKIYSLKDVKNWVYNNRKKIIFFLLVINKKIKGFIYYNFDSTKYFIYIKKRYRNNGFSVILLKKLIDFGKKKNLKITADVNVTNKKSLSLHKKFKFNKQKNFRIYKLLDWKL